MVEVSLPDVPPAADSCAAATAVPDMQARAIAIASGRLLLAGERNAGRRGLAWREERIGRIGGNCLVVRREWANESR
ncbi:hypothetical protein GCM10027400_21610 [Pseudoxanthomonas daejeonensis]